MTQGYETTSELMAAHPFLKGMTAEQLQRLAPWAHRQVFRAGTRVFSEGGRADRFWLIREGRVELDTQVPDEGTVVVDTLGPGAVLGWSWLFPPYRWHLGATATEQTLTIAFDAARVRELCAEETRIGHDLYGRFIEVVVNRLQATRGRLMDLYVERPAPRR
jgi:CRP/FNR family transcriptional regulator, cyclic AMP receptor protein